MSIKREQYSLGELVLKPKDKILLKGCITYPEKNNISKGFNDTFEHYPDPSFLKHFRGEGESQLKDVVIHVMGYMYAFGYKASEKIGKKEKDAFQALHVLEMQIQDFFRNGITVTGFKIDGGSKTTSIQLTYSFNPYGVGKGVEQKTPKINLERDVYGVEEDLKDMLTHIEDEAFEYGINFKTGEVEMDFEGEDENFEGEEEGAKDAESV